MRPLPPRPYEYAEWKKVRVNVDYHVEVDRHYYSAPYQLITQQLDARITANTVELLHKGRRVAGEAAADELHFSEAEARTRLIDSFLASAGSDVGEGLKCT